VVHPLARPAPEPAPGRARILVVDDELIVAEALRRALEPEHDVVAVARGADALDLLAAGRRFDLVLCDLMMPEVTGIEVHAEVARRFPEMLPRLVFMTGGAFTPEAREFLARVETPRLEKPIDLRGVRTFVRRFVR
jgi:CheY-like chemotaxis protein